MQRARDVVSAVIGLRESVPSDMEHSGANRVSARGWLRHASILLICCLLATTMLGQEAVPGTGALVFTVFAEESGIHLDRQALLKLVNLRNQAVMWQTTENESRGAFKYVPYGNYDVEVSAVGYISEHKRVLVKNTQPALFDIVLHRDPTAINLDVADRTLSFDAQRETNRAVSALKAGNYSTAEKHLAKAYKSASSSPEINFLLGYLYFQQKDFERAASYLGTATRLSPHDAAAVTLMGRTYLERQNYAAAGKVLERAVAEDAENWLGHYLLADTYLHQGDYNRARGEAQAAITKGKKEANPAWLVLGQALVNLGLDHQGMQAFDTFLQGSPRSPVTDDVRRLIAEVHQHESGAPPAEDATSIKMRLASVDPLRALAAPGLSVKSWQPPGIDESKIALASDVACPSQKVLEEAGKHVVQLVDDVGRFAAVEELFQQSLDLYGDPIRTEARKYNYVAAISQPAPGSLRVEEYRADKAEVKGYPDQIASTGFAALALVLHPYLRDTFDMRCEGLGDWHGQASWIVSFRQRDDRPNRLHSYKVNKFEYPVNLRGRAWITAGTFQVVRIESEMVSPVPEIKLLSEHWFVEYGPVRFDKRNVSLWLPKSAEIYFDFQQRRYYRRHRFDHYMLFSVDLNDKRKEPTSEPNEEPNAAKEKETY